MAKCEWMTAEDLKQNMRDGINAMDSAVVYGINNPRRPAMAEAAKRVRDGTWKKNFLAGVDKWFKNVQVPLDTWKKLCVDMADFYESNARTYGADNWEKFEEKMMPKMNSITQTFLDSKKDQAAYKAYWTAIQKAAEESK